MFEFSQQCAERTKIILYCCLYVNHTFLWVAGSNPSDDGVCFLQSPPDCSAVSSRRGTVHHAVVSDLGHTLRRAGRY